MKTMLIVALLVFFSLNTNAQPPFHWAKNLKNVSTKAIAVDDDENVYVTGNFEGKADFDPSADSFMLSSKAGDDIFIAKYDALGNFVWAIGIGSLENDMAADIKIGKDGNIYTTGGFYFTVDFDPHPSSTYILTSLGGNIDVYVLKLDRDGKFIWARGMGGLSFDVVYQLAIDDSNNVYTTGRGNVTGDYDPGIGVYNLPFGTLGQFAFISKLNKDGGFVWAKSISGYGPSDGATSCTIDVDKNQNVYISGIFYGKIDIDPSASEIEVLNKSAGDKFLVKLNKNGDLKWFKQFSYTASLYPSLATRVDNNGYTYTLLNASGTQDVNPDAGVDIVTCLGVLLIKIDTAGNYIWGKTLGATETKGDMILDNNNIYLTGGFAGLRDFDPGPGTFSLNSKNTKSDAYIAILDHNGVFNWAMQLGDTLTDAAARITVSKYGNIFSTGYFNGKVDFDPGLDSFFLVDYSKGAYIHKLSRCQVKSNAKKVACNFYDVGGKSFTKTGIYPLLFKSKTSCDSLVKLDLTVNKINDSIVSSGSTLTAKAIGASYQWVKCPSLTIIPGATSNSFSPTTSGSYAVVLSQFGCTDTSLCKNVFGTEIGEFSQNEKFKIYPNPSSGKFILELNEQKFNRIEVYNIWGTLIYQNHIGAVINEIDISQQAAGIYFVKIFEDGILNHTLKISKK